ncbi:hypothetical protein LCGC14_0526340 [marine sediment metagenome]|uniref:Uncharacterized protein n=1 Tax=marine sediment metagenome TaxID=412755 RepID=A0A0F9S1N7_9ZZZZ
MKKLFKLANEFQSKLAQDDLPETERDLSQFSRPELLDEVWKELKLSRDDPPDTERDPAGSALWREHEGATEPPPSEEVPSSKPTSAEESIRSWDEAPDTYQRDRSDLLREREQDSATEYMETSVKSTGTDIILTNSFFNFVESIVAQRRSSLEDDYRSLRGREDKMEYAWLYKEQINDRFQAAGKLLSQLKEIVAKIDAGPTAIRLE